MASTQAGPSFAANNAVRFLYLKEIVVDFTRSRPNCKLQIELTDERNTHYESKIFGEAEPLQWEYVKSPSMARLTVQNVGHALRRNWTAKLQLDFGATDFRENNMVERAAVKHGISVKFTYEVPGENIKIARLLADEAVSALSTKISVLEKMDKVLKHLDLLVKLGKSVSEINPIAKAAASSVETIFKKFQEIPIYHREFVDIVDDIVLIMPLFEPLHDRIEDGAVQEILESFTEFISRLSWDLAKYSSETKFKFLLHNWYNSKKNEAKDFHSRLLRFSSFLTLGLIHQQQQSEADNSLIRQLRPPENSSFDPTRSEDPNDQLYWIYGVAGCGKTSVAASVASRLELWKSLSGSFFCSRDIRERRDPVRLIHALIYFLARASLSFKEALLRLLNDDPDLLEKPLQAQINKLILHPFAKPSHWGKSRSITIVLDALDECEDSGRVASSLSRIIERVPPLKIIVTSPPLTEIQEGWDVLGQAGKLTSCNLFDVNAHNDILLFTREKFSKNVNLPSDFTESQIEALARKASGYFIWVTTVLKHVGNQLSQKREVLQRMLVSTPYEKSERKLDILYRQVLDDVSREDEDRMDTIKLLIGLVFVTSRNRPLPATALHAFVPSLFELDELSQTLQELGSVITAESQTDAIRVCHPSFLDFVGNRDRAGVYWMDSSVLDMRMAEGCLNIMISGLKFNICNLETSHLSNIEVHDLAERINECIPQQLQYRCMYWLDHLSRSRVDACCTGSIEQKLIRVFCQTAPLYWLEALSLMSELKAAVSILRDFLRLPKYKEMNDSLREAMEDLYRFAIAFHEPMAISAPHVYISALLWAPSKSVIARSQHQSFNSSRLVLEGLEEHWPIPLRTLSVGSKVYSVIYSPDGLRLFSGTYDGPIHILDAETGAIIGEPLRGHVGDVWSITCSADGRRIVSGSYDTTIRIWDAETGAAIGTPLQGHEHIVCSVAYSPDMSRIASGSYDKTIRIWDARTGDPIGKPFRGHEYGTIRIWDAKTGDPIDELLRGYERGPYSVAYSPDGRRIVAGFSNGAIRVWNTETGTPIGEPLQGHEDGFINGRTTRQ
ncbi:uncharacterized protein FOMMEDRAFT_157552 [Fomitiporia mediterranea MF3/22]|uniref:uncharacterized protein n=1 Tax=Fomitiporia mediterranea (strain MF3/22) TaxID=694068 RepID=UPI00044092A0|nr:uncharacterized protein FOMMEDRAFT_157552 [Fomitiporia mediterranea MF3/22]EJD02336.1 hypothetical protein FOMMEDRAFT_157552 [Fomitiporia mediterranea MF3/22]